MEKRQAWSDVLRAMIILWILVSPWILMHVSAHPVLPLEHTGVALLDFFVVGVALMVISVASSEVSTAFRVRTSAAVGLWLIVSPFLLGFHDTVLIWNAVIAGILVTATSGWSRGNKQPGTGTA